MEVGETGAPTHHAARLVVEERRGEPDSVATPPGRHMKGPGVRDHLLKHQTVTLTLVQ